MSSAVLYASVKCFKTNTCFVSVPKKWPLTQKSPPVVLEIVRLSDQKIMYMSWAGATTEDDDKIGFNSLFLRKLSLYEGQEVTVRCLGEEIKHCSDVHLEPEDEGGSENLALVQDKIIHTLLDQIRVVWKGLIFPIWINNATFCVRVAEITPVSEPAMLAYRTLLHIGHFPTTYRSNPEISDVGRNTSYQPVLSRPNSFDTHLTIKRFRRLFTQLLWTDPAKSERSTSPTNKFLPSQKIALALRTVPLADADCPTVVHVSESALVRRGYGATGIFLASITKLLSPREREEVRDKATSESEKKDPMKQSDSFVVYVLVSRRYQGEKVEVDLNENDVAVSHLLRRQMGLELGSRLKISSIDYEESTAHSITLFPLSSLSMMTTEESVVASFWSFVAKVGTTKPFVATSGSLIRLVLDDDLKVDFVMKISYSPSNASSPSSSNSFPEPPTTQPYCLLHFQRDARTVSVLLGKQVTPVVKKPWGDRLPFRSNKLLDKGQDWLHLNQIGGLSKPAEMALSTFELWLGLNPVSRQLFSVPPISRCLLICGQKGMGKSTLATALLQEMVHWGIFVSSVNCALLKGSSTKSIKKQMELLCAECVHRQPSVLLLDDVDVLAAAPTGPADEEGIMANYFASNAEVVRRMLDCALEKDVRISFLATSISQKTIHPSLMTNRGSHIFQSVIELQPPDLGQRREILISMLRQKAPSSVHDPTLIKIAQVTDGYLAQDLDTLVDRAKHAAWMRADPTEGEAVLTLRDFEEAKENFRPSSLRTVELNKATHRTWQEVGGLADVRRSLHQTLVWPTKYPTLFSSCPIRIQCGTLLYGPPGTGKTLLAGVVASECGLNFISIKGPELLSKYIGASEQAVRDLFTRAQSAKPCILFFDEFDAIAPKRGHDSTGVTDRVVNQFLTQMDGVESLKGVYVLAATSRPDMLDPALLRPGRLDKCLYCPLPDQSDRQEILECLSRHLTLEPDVDLASLASRTEHFSGADLQALLYTAQLESIHSCSGRRKSGVTSAPEEDFMCITCDGDGPKDLQRDERQRILQQIATVKENVLGKGPVTKKGRKSTCLSICVSPEHLELALSKTKPSVTPEERFRYQMLFESYSKGLMPPAPQGKRITLA